MKRSLVVGGLLLLVVGSIVAYDGHVQQKSLTARMERGANTLVEIFNDRTASTGSNNREATFKFFGGSLMALFGLAMVYVGLSEK